MQAASAFTTVQAAFNWLVDNYPRLAEWGASARRVASLELSLDALDRADRGLGLINRGEGDTAALRCRQDDGGESVCEPARCASGIEVEDVRASGHAQAVQESGAAAESLQLHHRSIGRRRLG